jgi:hypothetical protein
VVFRFRISFFPGRSAAACFFTGTFFVAVI